MNFINAVSTFYLDRRGYRTSVLDEMSKDLSESKFMQSADATFDISFPEYVYLNWSFLMSMKSIRDECMRMMNVDEKDLDSYSRQLVKIADDPEMDSLDVKMYNEWLQAEEIIKQAKEKIKE